MRPFLFLLTLALSTVPPAAKPVPKKRAPKKAAPAKAAPKSPRKPMSFEPVEFDLAPGETYPVDLFVPSPSGKAVTGALAFASKQQIAVKPDSRWDGKVPAWGVKTFPQIVAGADAAEGDHPVTATLSVGGSATLQVHVVTPKVEPVPGLRQLTVRITNPFRKRLLFGKIKASNPDRFLENITTREFKIPAGQSGEVVFPLPGAAPAENQTYDFTLTVESYNGWRFQRTYPLSFPPHT
jgi:hypothetical protein